MTINKGINLAGLVGLIVGILVGVSITDFITSKAQQEKDKAEEYFRVEHVINQNSEIQRFEMVNIVIDGDEVPGIGADRAKPDTCLAFYSRIDDKIHIRYK